MKRLAFLLLPACLAGLTGQPAAAQQPAPVLDISSERLCTDRPPPVFSLQAEATGLTPPLHFLWDLGDGRQWEGKDVPELPWEFGRYNVILSVSDAAGRVQKASIALDASGQGCGGGF